MKRLRLQAATLSEATGGGATLSGEAGGTILPGFDRTTLHPRIVHLGLGAFVRAHLADYTEDALALGGSDWGIVGVSLQRPDQRDRLAPQDGLYVALTRDSDRVTPRIIGCLLGVLVAPENPQAVIAALASPDCRIASLTITEKGYCHDPSSGALNVAHPDVQHDIAHPAAPRTAIGFIVASLAERRAAGLLPFTVLCCDNLPHNGVLVAGLVDAFARTQDPELADWIAHHGAFPATMVDRIVPATTEADLTDAARLTGLDDAATVSHERFRQWVIEDRFVGDSRPAWKAVGAQFVRDVAPFEHMKLRLLNGAHSALAYLGYLCGRETIVDAVSDDVLRRFTLALWNDEIIPVVPPPPGVDLAAYANELMRRFENSAIRHRTWQIAADGSQKLPQRILASVRDRLAQGLPIRLLAHVVAAWIVYVGGVDEQGAAIDVRDPLAASLRARLDHAGDDPAARVAAIIGVAVVFGPDLPDDAGFVAEVTAAYAALHAQGARMATETLLITLA